LDPDQNADQDPDPGTQENADPDPDPGTPKMRIKCRSESGSEALVRRWLTNDPDPADALLDGENPVLRGQDRERIA